MTTLCAAALLLPFAVVMLALWSLSVPRVTAADVDASGLSAGDS